MSLADDLANDLAARVIAYVEESGDEEIIKTLSQAMGDSSQTLQEAFITSVRVQRAAIRAQTQLDARIKAHAAKTTPPEGMG